VSSGGPVALDATVLIAHFGGLDAHHAAASRMLREAAAENWGLVIHPITLAECLVGAARNGRAHQRHRQIEALGVVVAPIDHDAPLRLAELRAETRLRIPDCCVLDVAQTLGAGVVTFDGLLAETGRSLGVTVLPS
jgi:predicted nucleic acid-binding protein